MSKLTAANGDGSRRPRLPALAGVRIFPALHIYCFHLKQAHDAGLLRFPGISALPAPLASLMGRGHVSTGLFFQLSGFLLATRTLIRRGGRRRRTGRSGRAVSSASIRSISSRYYS